jgi:thioredoxin-like negative regulator of GroEL
VVGKVDGDASPELRALLNVTVYPTFLLINKDGTKVLGRYLGPRKVFELSNWIEDLIVAAENPVVKHQFELTEQGEHADLHPVFPYSGENAFKDTNKDAKLATQALASVSVGLMGNEFDECLESDEAKFTAPGAALLVHYSSDKHSLELDSQTVSTSTVPQKLTVIDFYASWCPHCQKLNPVWDQLTSELGADKVVIGKIEMETHTDVKKQFGIHRFPTIMYFEAGKPMAYDENRRYTGQRDVDHLKQWIQNLMH